MRTEQRCWRQGFKPESQIIATRKTVNRTEDILGEFNIVVVKVEVIILEIILS